MLRHGRSSALFVALKECPSVVYTDNICDKLHRVVLSFLLADRVSTVMLMKHSYKVATGEIPLTNDHYNLS